MAGVGTTTIRISNHSANPQNFGSTDNNVGIVIKTSNHRFRPENGTNYVDLMYYGDKVSGNAALQREIVSGLRHYIETGSFEKMPEPDGQKIAQVVKKSTTRTLDDIDNMMAEAINRMSSTVHAVSDEAALEYAGLQIARQYVEDIRESKNEERDLAASIKEAQEEYEQGNMTHEAYLQYKAATEDAIRQSKIDRAEAYRKVSEQLGGVLGESVSRAKAWREEQKARVEEIHHNSNSYMKGKRQAGREGGRILTLQESNVAGNASQGLSSDSKYKALLSDKQGKGEASYDDYTITPTEYQDKKKKTPVWVVKFDRDLSYEEKRALVAYMEEPLTEGKMTSRGWLDKESGQFYMQSEEAAKDYREAAGLYETGEDTGAAGSGHSTQAVGPGHSTPPRAPATQSHRGLGPLNLHYGSRTFNSVETKGTEITLRSFQRRVTVHR